MAKRMKRLASSNLMAIGKRSAGSLTSSLAPPAKRAATTAAAADTTPGQCCNLPPLKPGELMHSTKRESANKRKWVALCTDKSRNPDSAYCSTDGSSTGWHAAVFVAANSQTAHLRATHRDHLGSRNVGAEAFGVNLGVAILPPDCTQCVFLADFLNALAWDVGGANYKHPAVVDAYDGAQGVKALRGVRGHTRMNTMWHHVHHPGHQTDSSWFTQLNQVADNLASLREEVDCVVPLESLAMLTTQGKSAGTVCKNVIVEHTPSVREEGE